MRNPCSPINVRAVKVRKANKRTPVVIPPPAVPNPVSNIPALSQPFLLYVADDIDMTAGTWTSRVSAGVTPMVLVKSGNPVKSLVEAWANGHAVMSGEGGGCFYLDRPYGFPTTHGFSLSAVMGGQQANNVPSFYNGPKILAATNAAGMAMCGRAARVRVGSGAAGRFTDCLGSADPVGDLLQWDRPAGDGVLLSAWTAYRNNVAQTITTGGTYGTIPDGVRFVIGGYVPSTGVDTITTNTNSRVLAMLLTVGGQPMSAEDRAIWKTFADGLKA